VAGVIAPWLGGAGLTWAWTTHPAESHKKPFSIQRDIFIADAISKAPALHAVN
jgi:hypothetical protein